MGSRSYGKEAWRKGNSPKLALFERRCVGREENIFPTVAGICGELLANCVFFVSNSLEPLLKAVNFLFGGKGNDKKNSRLCLGAYAGAEPGRLRKAAGARSARLRFGGRGQQRAAARGHGVRLCAL